jgi:hypothetical protein
MMHTGNHTLCRQAYVHTHTQHTCSGVTMPNVVHTSMPSPLILDTISSTRFHCLGPTCSHDARTVSNELN